MENRYIQFPLFLLRDVFTNKKKAFNDILDFGIWYYSKKIKFTIHDVSRQLMYDHYRGELPTKLAASIKSYVRKDHLTLDEDYNGFCGVHNKFTPDNEIEELKVIFQKDQDFKQQAIDHYSIHQALSFLKITNSNELATIKNAKMIEKEMPKNCPMPMINVDRLFNFRDHDKSEFELVQFATYIGLRSILGNKQYCKTNKLHLISRAFGYTSHRDVPNRFVSADVGMLHNKYSKRYHIDKIIEALELNWGVIVYSKHTRGLYISMENKMSIYDLALVSESRKQKQKLLRLKATKDDAQKQALEQLKKVTS